MGQVGVNLFCLCDYARSQLNLVEELSGELQGCLLAGRTLSNNLNLKAIQSKGPQISLPTAINLAHLQAITQVEKV